MTHHHVLYKIVNGKIEIVAAGNIQLGDHLEYLTGQSVKVTDIEECMEKPFNILTSDGDIMINGIVATGFTTTTINLKKYLIIAPFVPDNYTQAVTDMFINTNKLTQQKI